MLIVSPYSQYQAMASRCSFTLINFLVPFHTLLIGIYLIPISGRTRNPPKAIVIKETYNHTILSSANRQSFVRFNFDALCGSSLFGLCRLLSFPETVSLCDTDFPTHSITQHRKVLPVPNNFYRYFKIGHPFPSTSKDKVPEKHD